MLSFVTRLWVRWLFARLARGDVDAMMKTFARDAVFKFPGDSSWAGEHRGHDEIRRWLTRFAATKMQFAVHEVAVSGMPWDMRIFTRFVDRNVAPDGTVVYQNDGVLFDRVRWFKIYYHENNTDTQRIVAFDEYLASHGDKLAQAAVEARTTR